MGSGSKDDYSTKEKSHVIDPTHPRIHGVRTGGNRVTSAPASTYNIPVTLESDRKGGLKRGEVENLPLVILGPPKGCSMMTLRPVTCQSSRVQVWQRNAHPWDQA